ncbi:uncharacterized protein LOC131218736 [Magnolia sinica]|uniref:uncharacterized protein LOC131218736 n=1 Tax=Magnolia sinica TaxID=86752 RepID=UPI002657C5D8|nr:uncharacterized protein LOC131218736 [Magnolia sinica]
MVAMAAEALMAGKTAGEVGLLLGPPTEFGACRTRFYLCSYDGSLVTSKLIHYESFFNEDCLCATQISLVPPLPCAYLVANGAGILQYLLATFVGIMIFLISRIV